MTDLFGPPSVQRNSVRDPDNIIPRGARGAAIMPVALQVRIMHDYDVVYMRDRITADLFANGQPLGIHARALMEDREWVDPADAIHRYGPELQRLVLGQFSQALTLQPRLDVLEAQVKRLHEDAAARRRSWWRRAYDRAGSWVSGVR